MKRSRPLISDPEKTRAWQERSRKPLERGELKPRPPAPKPKEQRMDKDVCAQVFWRQQGKCVCGCGRRIAPFPIGYHHILPRQRWPELTNEPDDIVGVAADCHANHETGTTRLPRSACALAERLAICEPRRASYLNRTYGPLSANTSLAPDEPHSPGVA